MEAELLYAGDYLLYSRVLELADNCRRNQRVDLVLCVVLRFFENIDCIEHQRLVGNRAERALIHARAACDALVVVDAGFFVLVHRNRTHFAADHARTMLADYRAVWASLSALAALDALLLVDDRLFVDNRNRASRADVLTTMNDAASARGGDENAVNRALVAGNVDDLDDVRIILVAAERELNTLLKYRAFLVDAATHARLGTGDDFLGNIGVNARHIAVVGAFDYLFEYFVFQFLYFCVEYFFHSPLIIFLEYTFVK